MTSNPLTHAQHTGIRPELAKLHAMDDLTGFLFFGDPRWNGEEKVLLTKEMDDKCLIINADRAFSEMTRLQTLSHPPRDKTEEFHLIAQEVFRRYMVLVQAAKGT